MSEHDETTGPKPIQPYVPLHRAPKGVPSRREKERAEDREIDRALQAEAERPTAGPAPDVNLKRQWDDDLEAELEAAMAGFDARSLDVPRPGRSRAEDRAHKAMLAADIGRFLDRPWDPERLPRAFPAPPGAPIGEP